MFGKAYTFTFESVTAILNEAARGAGMPSFEECVHFENGPFTMEGRFHHYQLRPPSESYVGLVIEASVDGITLHIDRMPEALEWGRADIADPDRVVEHLAAFLSGYLVIEHRDKRRTQYTLFSASGAQEWSYKRTAWPGSDSLYERRLFLPLNTLPTAA